MKFRFTDFNYFFVFYALFIIAGSIGQMYFGKIDLQIWLNKTNNESLDYFFFAITNLVAGVPLVFILLSIGFFSNIKNMIIGVACYAFTGIAAQLLKRGIIGNIPRPTAVINNLDLIDESFKMKQHTLYSFPSGHTTTAFVLAIFFTWSFKNKKLGFLFAFIAALIGYSRVYLSQHFLVDVLAGSVLGVIGGLAIIKFLSNVNFGKWGNYNLLGKIYETN